MSSRIAMGDIEAAINRARATQPATGTEASLSLEVATLAALYGRLIWQHHDGVALADLSDAERLALQLWLPMTLPSVAPGRERYPAAGSGEP